jgi:hypothetical protein
MTYNRTSPSQITTWQLCRRRWHFGSVKYLPQPQSPEAEKGEDMHGEMEDLELEGIRPVHPSCRLAADLPEMRDAKPGDENIIVEAYTTKPPLMFIRDEAGLYRVGAELQKGDKFSVGVKGRVDRLDARDPVHPVVLDWKSKGKTLRGLSPAKLELDPQLLLYGAWAMLLLPEAEDVVLAHGYLGREEEFPYAKVVKTRPLLRSVVLERTAMFGPQVEQMAKDAEVENTLDLPLPPLSPSGRRQACHAFGTPCPFLNRCFPTGTEAFSEAFAATPDEDEEVVPMSLLDKLQSQPGAASISTPPPSAGPTSATAAPTPGSTDAAAPFALEGLYLYIDIVAEKGPDASVTRLEDEIAKRTEAILKEHGAKTLFDAPLNFGKGKNLLVESFRTNPPIGVVVASCHGISADILEVLKPHAIVVWRGV